MAMRTTDTDETGNQLQEHLLTNISLEIFSLLSSLKGPTNDL